MNCARARQTGQAMAEGLLVLAGLAGLWTAVWWLYRVQDIALSAQHATSYLAFTASRREGDLARLHERFFAGPGVQWNDLGGQPMLSDLQEQARLTAFRSQTLPSAGQPGASAQHASLRQDWALEDRGVLHAALTIAPSNAPIALRRHTAILTGAGHAGDDEHVQQVLVQSGQAWRHDATTSYRLSGTLRGVVGPVDAGWGRSLPDVDWSSAWAGIVPISHLQAAKEQQ